jgi:hypothetical protein
MGNDCSNGIYPYGSYGCGRSTEIGFDFVPPEDKLTACGTITVVFKLGIVCNSGPPLAVHFNGVDVGAVPWPQDCRCYPVGHSTSTITIDASAMVPGTNSIRFEGACFTLGLYPLTEGTYATVTYGI